MTENDYIAEYVKEKRPELINSFDFFGWKLARMLANSLNGLTKALKDAIATLPEEELEKIMKEGNDEKEKEIL